MGDPYLPWNKQLKTEKPRVRFCWECGKKLRGNHFAEHEYQFYSPGLVPITIGEKMDLDNLTIGEVKQLTALLGQTNSPDPARSMIGKTCMFRTYSAGVHFGELAEKSGQTCLVKNAQRVFYWTEACSLSQLAMEGSKNFDGCKIAMPIDEMVLEQVIEIIPMPQSVVSAFRGAKVWKK